MINKSAQNRVQGKKNRAAGAAFERKVRAHLSTEGYTVSKWNNNIDLDFPQMHACRWNRFNAAGGGFPDFICFKNTNFVTTPTYHVIFVEAKLNGFLTKTEKAKMKYMQEERGFTCFVAYAEESEESGVRMREYVHSDAPEKIKRG